ncbi:MAG TPA: hypothetical protein VF669_19395 [Tepidisphaeraceae bacterium]
MKHRWPITSFLILTLISTRLSAQDQSPATIDQETCTVKLSDGLELQVIGLCDHPLDGQSWWKPDGSKLENPPYDKMEGSVSGADKKIRHVALRIANHPQVPDTIDVDYTPPANGSSSSTPTLNGQETRDLQARLMAFPGDAAAITVKFKVATGEWKTTAKKEGQSFSASNSSDEGFIWTTPHADGKRTAIVLAFYGKKRGMDKRLIAVDRQGKEHTAWSSYSSGLKDVSVFECTFDLKLSQIKEYQLQQRDYDTVVEFKNVSLDRDQHQNVEIEVRGVQEGD